MKINNIEKMVKLIALSIMMLLLSMITQSQDDGLQVEYGETYTYTPQTANEQYFAQFTGEEGDVVYVLADYEEFVIGDIDVDLRDSVGRTVGFKNEYAFEKFVIGELPSSGLYTVVITAEEPEAVKFIVGVSGYLEDGVEATIEEDGFKVFLGVRATQDGAHTLQIERTNGDLGTDFSIITFSEFFSENIISISGTDVNSITAEIDLNEGDQYIAILGRNLFGSGRDATVSILLEPLE
jgi:hypothetical protein